VAAFPDDGELLICAASDGKIRILAISGEQRDAAQGLRGQADAVLASIAVRIASAFLAR
jgi:hypothetical protein